MQEETITQRGFSILELLIATFAFLLVLGSAFLLIGQSTNITRAQQPLAFAQNDLRNAVTIMTKDIQQAGFFDTITTTRTKSSNTFVAIPSTSATSTSFQLIVQQWNGSADTQQTITYTYDATARQLRRNNVTLLGNASPLDASTPVFAYVDDPNDTTAKIGVTVQVMTDTGQREAYTKQPITRQLSTTILSRNGKYASDRLTLESPSGSSGSGSGSDFSNIPVASN